jgi:GDP-4-dehydro-6-deoxy-D-mannose reductase
MERGSSNGSIHRSPVLVTGAAGFAGSHLMEHLARSRDVEGWTRSAPPPGLGGVGRWRRVDLLDREAVRAAVSGLRPSAIYHCAGMPHVGASWADTAQPLASNVLATHHLFDALRRAGISCRVLVPGSATVYAPASEPIAEDHPVAPASPYALSKLAQEQLALRAGPEDGIDVVLTRSFNHTGPRQTPAFVAPSIARQIALIEKGELDPVIRVGNLDVQRDITDVRDVVRAYVALMERATPAVVYNVASGVGRTMRSVLEAIVSRASVRVRIETDPARLRPNDLPVVIGDASRIRHATGWQPLIPFDRMLDDLLEYWRREVRTQPG